MKFYEDKHYTSSQARKIVGISYRQLDYWDRQNIVKSSVALAKGSGTKRLYSFADLLTLKIVKRLCEKDVALKSIQSSLSYLQRELPHKMFWQNLTFLTNGKDVFILTNDGQKVLEITKGGQFVFGVAVSELQEELRTQIYSKLS